MQKLDIKTLPEAVRTAVCAAEQILDQRFEGRRSVPSPVIGSFPVDETEELIYFVLLPPAMVQRDAIMKATVAMGRARDRGETAFMDALTKYRSTTVVECCYYVSGMPEPTEKQDPRAVARDYLKSLLDEPGSLGEALATVSNAVLEMTEVKGATLGKVQTP